MFRVHPVPRPPFQTPTPPDMLHTFSQTVALFERGGAVSEETAKELARRVFSAFRFPECKRAVHRNSLLDGSFGGYASDTCFSCNACPALGGTFKTYFLDHEVEDGSVVGVLLRHAIKRRRCAACVEEAKSFDRWYNKGPEELPLVASGASLTFTELVALFCAGGPVGPDVARELVGRLFEAFRDPACTDPVTPFSLLDCSFGGYRTNKCYKCRAPCRPEQKAVYDLASNIEHSYDITDHEVRVSLVRWMCAACTDDLI